MPSSPNDIALSPDTLADKHRPALPGLSEVHPGYLPQCRHHRRTRTNTLAVSQHRVIGDIGRTDH
jgi:hypothetical protein